MLRMHNLQECNTRYSGQKMLSFIHLLTNREQPNKAFRSTNTVCSINSGDKLP